MGWRAAEDRRAGHQLNSTTADARSSYWVREPSALLAALGVSADGLTLREARSRRRTFGSNAIRSHGRGSGPRIFLAQFRSPLVLILIVAAMIAILVGQFDEALIIWAIVLASCLLSFSQEYRASNAMYLLRQRIAHKTVAFRDGVAMSVPVEEIVPGDVLSLSAGNLIPADGVVLEATDFDVSEAALTGEAFPVSKVPGVSGLEAPIAERSNVVFAGTSVRSGIAKILVVETGARTEFATIAEAIEQQAPDTEFTIGIRRFGYLMTEIMLAMVIMVFVANLLLDRPLVDSLLFSLALAVGLTPELLPAIISVTLARGARAMEKSGVIVRRLASIENLGSMNLLCTDKTGTLTQGVVRLGGAIDFGGKPSPDVLFWAALNATMQSGLANPLDEAIAQSPDCRNLDLSGFVKIDEIPYDFARKRLSVIFREKTGTGRDLLICKGALANVLGISTALMVNDTTQPLVDEQRLAIDKLYRELSDEGYRVLGVAVRQFARQQDYDRKSREWADLCGVAALPRRPKGWDRPCALGAGTKGDPHQDHYRG